MTANWEQIYSSRFPTLEQVAVNLCSYLRGQLGGLLHIDRVTARAKSPERFAAKASKACDEGNPKYESPMSQIQDQLGARIVVFYLDDIPAVTERLQGYLRHIEREDRIPESDWEFGYFGRHWIFATPEEVLDVGMDQELIPRFFELQVKTLFQHAWSEANHDLAYKPLGELRPDQRRRFAYTAAQAWGADRVFSDLYKELVVDRGAVNSGAE